MGTHWIDEGCINCGACADVCPVNAISEELEVHVISKEPVPIAVNATASVPSM